MKHANALRQLGTTQQRLLRKLLSCPQGATVEDLCHALGITHNAVRQHLAALMAAGFVEHGESVPSGGRPRACYILQPAGRELFPRNYALIARGMIEYLYAHEGTAAVQGMLAEMGARLGDEAATRIAAAGDVEEATRLLAEQLDALGYEAQTVRSGDHEEVEAWNCVFHSLARAHPDVCRFDIAFMSAATGRPVQRTQCMLHGAPTCRFRLAADPAKPRGT
jgi:predicted ArsR family transcriptional regulator